MRTWYRDWKLAGVALALVVTLWAHDGGPSVAAQPAGGQVTTLAGSGESAVVDGPSGVARFAAPAGIAVDGAGVLYVTDSDRIRRVSPSGAVQTVAGGEEAGFADGPAATARFNSPQGIAVDAAGTLYIADRENQRIRKITAQGVVSTLAGSGTPGFADGPGDQAQFNQPYGVAVDAVGTVYVADALNHRIRRISPQGAVTTLAGGGDEGDYADGPGAAARFSFPNGVAVDQAGTVYVADTYNARIRAISPQGNVRTVAGSGESGDADGPALGAQFADPYAIAVDGSGALYVLDKSNRVRLIANGEVRTLAGSGVQGFADGSAETAQFDGPLGIAVDAAGTVFIADTGNHRIRVLPALP